ncbi:MAG: ABC transporter ATP-binding protein [Paracoccaceae bacterium]|nr:ABC transporter ATP-binding protein [Paracoccaceae bacterium]
MVGCKTQRTGLDMPVLEVSGYSLSYNTQSGPLEALKNIDLSVAHGQTHGLVGESGSGKSSLAWAILRYLPENAVENDGKLLLSGESLRDRTLSQILEIRGQRISMVFQDPSTSLNPAMRLGEQLSEVMIRHRGLTEQEALEESELALARTGITKPREMLRRYPHEASGGEKQRVVIATAFACNPELIIFDEPTTALDIITAQQILELFNELQDETSISALYISHDLGLVSRVADTVSVLRSGEVVENGLRADIFRTPRDTYTKALLGAVPDPKHWLGVKAPSLEAPILMSAESITVKYGHQSRIGQFFASKPTHLGAHNVSLKVRKGELVGLVGESGSGKSTMARVLSGLQNFDGAVRFGDRLYSRLGEIDKFYRRAVQIVFQHPDASLNPRQRVHEILSRPLKLYHIVPQEQQAERVAELLEKVRLPREFVYRFPHQLSGGEKQRVAIARAFAAEPELVICDEITASLDVSVQASVADLLVNLQRETGTACLFITHDLNLVRQLAHRICVMQHGKLVDEFDRNDAETPDRNPYTRALLHAVPPPAGEMI